MNDMTLVCYSGYIEHITKTEDGDVCIMQVTHYDNSPSGDHRISIEGVMLPFENPVVLPPIQEGTYEVSDKVLMNILEIDGKNLYVTNKFIEEEQA